MPRSDRAIPEEDIGLRQAAQAYVIALYRELTEEKRRADARHAEPGRGLHPGRSGAAAARRRVGRDESVEEATTAPPQRLPQDKFYVEVRTLMEQIMAPPVFETPGTPAALTGMPRLYW